MTAAQHVEQLPNGAVRTHGVADKQMIYRIGRAEYTSKRLLWWAIGTALILGPTVVSLLQRDLDLAMFMIQMIGGPIVFAVFAFALLRSAPTQWLAQLPPGTPLYVDFGPDEVAMGWSDTRNSIGFAQIERVVRRSSVLAVKGLSSWLYLPEELLPADAAAALLSGRSAELVPKTQPAPEAPPPGVIRTQAVADATLARRLARSTRQSPGIRWTLWAALIPPALGVADYLRSGADLWSTSLPALTGLSLMVLVILVLFVYFIGPAYLRKMVPEGAPIAAEFGRDSITVRLGAQTHTVGMRHIIRINQGESALLVTARPPAVTFMIPDELVPPSVAEDLLHRFRRGRWRRTG